MNGFKPSLSILAVLLSLLVNACAHKQVSLSANLGKNDIVTLKN